ncbi:F-box domain-containing protein [Hirschfeldia incana]|nr:F-box domain-containing protein [Hirschfeldia incana]
MYLVPDLLEEIFLRLPLKSTVKFKTVSKQWRSILESLRFAERRKLLMMNAQTKTKIMVGGDRRNRISPCFKRHEEVEIVYLQFDVASRPVLSCDGLVCIPVPGWVNVFNPSTGEFVRFSSGRDPPIPRYADSYIDFEYFDVFPGYWRMGFGRDNVSGNYKIVRMGSNHHGEIHRCEILDVNIGRWQKLSPPPYKIGYRRKSTCVNGSIYWVEACPHHKLLALDLHAQEWRDVRLPLGALGKKSCQVANLENRLAVAATYIENDHWNVKIWSVEAPEETWSVIYSICLSPLRHLHPYDDLSSYSWFWIRPVAVSKQGYLFFQDSCKRLIKYYPETGEFRFISTKICVISPFVENLVPLGRLDSKTYGLKHLDQVPFSSRISNFFRPIELRSPSILVITAVATLVMFRYLSRS